ncbi:MAG: hypothetical protein RLZZ238_1583 [Planctomycetota bacterium]
MTSRHEHARGPRHGGAPHRPESWREKLLSYATVTATAALIWIWASNQTRQSADANCRVHFLPADRETQSVGPEEPVSVRLQFTGSKSAVEAAVNAVNGRIFDLTVGTTGIPSEPGSHDIPLAQILKAVSGVSDSGAALRAVQPQTASIVIETIVRREARVIVRPAGRGALTGVTFEPRTVSVWVPEALLPKLPSTLVVEAVVPQTGLEESEVTLSLPSDIAAVVGKVRIDPPRVTVRPTE